MFHQICLLRNLPSFCNKSRNGTFTPSTIGDRVEEGRAGVSLKGPSDSTPLAPILLLHTVKVDDLVLQVISESPPLLIKALRIS
jgi:hypothetical protein